MQDADGIPSGAMTVRFWGVRGSVPVWAEAARRSGGNTPCVEVRCGETVLIFDAGTGLNPAGLALEAEGIQSCHLLFSHCHYDHIIGLPFFRPLYNPAAKLHFWSGHLDSSMTTQAMLHRFLEPPFLPGGIAENLARANCHDFQPGDQLDPVAGIVVNTARLDHPGGAVGYRVSYGGKSLAYLTDVEHQPGVCDPDLIRLAAGADLLIYDSMLCDEEFAARRGFGHSTWQQGVKLMQQAGAARLALFHHAPDRTDADLDRIEQAAAAIAPQAFAAREGQVLKL